jgi:hypothetical protein
MRRDLTRDVVAVQGGLGELLLTADELRFVSAAGAVTVPRSDLDELQWLHGLVVVGNDAFLLDPDDQLALLGALDPAWGAEDLDALALPPDDLLDELAALDDEAVATARDAAAAAAPPPPDAAERIDRPAPAPNRRGADEAADDGGAAARVADVASSPVAEEVAATLGKMLGVNKGTTRSLFRAFRKGRR